MASTSSEASVWVLRMPAGDERPHLIRLELMPTIDGHWDDPAPNVLAFWGREGWARRWITTFPRVGQNVSAYSQYWTMWRGNRQPLPLNKYISSAKTKVYGDAFFVRVKTDWSKVPCTLRYRDIPHSFMESKLVRDYIEHHRTFGAGDDAAT